MGKKKEDKKSKSGSPATTLIVALISSIIFFLIGVEVGKEYAIREGMAPVEERVTTGAASVATPEAPPDKGQEKVDINFYDQLMKEGDQELNAGDERPASHSTLKKKKAKTPSRQEERNEAPPGKKAEASTGKYALQVAAFREKARARRMAEMLRKEGYTPHIIPVVIPGKTGTYYRIWVGYYRNLMEASRARRRMLQNRALKISRATIVKR